MNGNNRIIELFQKYLSRTISGSEKQEFLDFVENPLYKKQIQELLSDAFDNQTDAISLSSGSRTRILNQILKKDQEEFKRTKHKKLWIRIAVAASVLLCLSIGLYKSLPVSKKFETVAVSKNDKAKDSSKVYLTLANGDRIALSDKNDGQIASQSGITITKASGGQLIYSISDPDYKVSALEYNTIETPRGGQYQLSLPDGTKVWLNAASSLKYPVSFSASNQRKVTLRGEGYFEVSTDKNKPFIVVTDEQEVEVLGTHFNINAYSNRITKTTLLEGAVKVSLPGKIKLESAILKPGEMAINDSKKISVSEAPYANNEIAWKEGYFVFNNANIKDIMEDLSNWYDLEVVYEGDMSDVYFHGNYLRSRSVINLLKSIELTNKVKFKIEQSGTPSKERRITVTKITL